MSYPAGTYHYFTRPVREFLAPDLSLLCTQLRLRPLAVLRYSCPQTISGSGEASGDPPRDARRTSRPSRVIHCRKIPNPRVVLLLSEWSWCPVPTAFRSSIAPPNDTSVYLRPTSRGAARKTRSQDGFAVLLSY